MLNKDEIRAIVDGERRKPESAEVRALREHVQELEWYIEACGPAVAFWFELLQEHGMHADFQRDVLHEIADVHRLRRWKERARAMLRKLREKASE